MVISTWASRPEPPTTPKWRPKRPKRLPGPRPLNRDWPLIGLGLGQSLETGKLISISHIFQGLMNILPKFQNIINQNTCGSLQIKVD